MKYILIPILSCSLLLGCSEEEGNEELIANLEEQNQTLIEQNNQLTAQNQEAITLLQQQNALLATENQSLLDEVDKLTSEKSATAEMQEQNDQLTEQNTALNEQVDDLLSENQDAVKSLEEQNTTLESLLEELNSLNASLAEQNTLLQERVAELVAEREDTGLIVTGMVKFKHDDSAVNNATIKYRLGFDWSDPIEVVDGQYRIDDLPGYSDTYFLIESKDDAFAPRELFVETGFSSGNYNNYWEFPDLYVSRVETLELSILNEETNEVIEGLSITGSYTDLELNQNHNVFEEKQTFSSNFDSETGVYSLTLPVDFNWGELTASLDIDGDGVRDFTSNHEYRYEFVVYKHDVESYENPHEYQLKPYVKTTPIEEQPLEITINVSVLDSSLTPIEGASVVVNDSLNDNVTATFNAETKQYTMAVKLDYSVDVMLEASSYQDSENKFYRNASFSIRNEGDRLRFFSSSLDQNFSYYITGGTGVYDVVAELDHQYSYRSNSELDLVNSSFYANEITYRAFFSQPITIDDDSFELTRREIKITRGNDSDSDLVLPGNTFIETVDVEIKTQTTLSLNDTYLIVEPKEALSDNTYHQLSVSHVNNAADDSVLSLGQSYSGTTGSNSELIFDINDIVLDNNNYFANGTQIHTANTAGTAYNISDNDSKVYIMLPASISTLETLTLQQVIITNDNVERQDVETYYIVQNGNYNYVYSKLFVSLAGNESVRGTSANHGSTVTDGYHRYKSTYEYMSDNTDTNTNTNEITFEYAYETKTGEVSTGQITLPVN